ncbi:hypothetical protein [Streptomyces tremellae]|uniref:Uncharacterized protein n=1 Tax=Streptomyces tremellae TaxID=1124239 RepID=A0ABP7EET1_9ACTN
MITQPVYATREDVANAADGKVTARADRRLDRALEQATESVDGLCHRHFAPTIATRFFDWPNGQYARPWRLWLDANELISVTEVTSEGQVIDPSAVLLEPQAYGPPYNRIELDISTTSGWVGGDTHQRNIGIKGLWGDTDQQSPLGAATGAVDTLATRLDVDGETAAEVGVGSIVTLDTERLMVIGRRQADTGQTLAAEVGAQAAATTLTVQDGDAFGVGETVLVDSERMQIVDIAGPALTVRRGWDGSVLAAHAASAAVWASRRLTVRRAVLGTTAAVHPAGTGVRRWDPPALVRQLTIAEALVSLGLEAAAYTRTVITGSSAGGTGSGTARDSSGVQDLRDRTYEAHGRKARLRAV